MWWVSAIVRDRRVLREKVARLSLENARLQQDADTRGRTGGRWGRPHPKIDSHRFNFYLIGPRETSGVIYLVLVPFVRRVSPPR